MSEADKSLQDLVAILKVMAPHVETIRGDLHKLQLQQVEVTGELKSIRGEMSRMEDSIALLTSKIDGQPGDDPLPSRVRAVEGELSRVFGRIDGLKIEIGTIKKADGDLRKSKFSGRMQVMLAIITGIFAFAGIAVQGYFASRPDEVKPAKPPIYKLDHNYVPKK